MFAQYWGATVNWCNPPFVVIPRVIALLRSQKATAAVVMPTGGSEWWSDLIDERVPVVQAVLHLYSGDLRGKKRGRSNVSRASRPNHGAIVFFDFGTRPPTRSFRSTALSADQLRRDLSQTSPAKSTTFLRLT